MKKRIFVILLGLFAVIGLVSCELQLPLPSESVTPTESVTVDPVIAELEDAKGMLIPLIRDPRNMVSDVELPTLLGDIEVVWESSEPGVIGVVPGDGVVEIKVNRPAPGQNDVEVNLIGTLSKDGKSVELVFELYVPAQPVIENMISGTIAHVQAEASKGDWVQVEDATVVGHTKDGLYLGDGTGFFFVYFKGVEFDQYAVGNVYNVQAEFDLYYSAAQLVAGYVNSGEPIKFFESEAEAFEAVPTPKTIEEIATSPKPTDTNVLFNQYVEIEGIIVVDGVSDYNTTIIDGDHSILFYYQGNKAAVESFAGKKVKLSGFIHAWRTDREVWTINFVGTEADIEELVITPEEVFSAAKAKLGVIKNIYFDQEISLPGQVDDVTVVWASSHPEVIGLDGLVVAPAEAVEVTLTATLTATINGVEHTDTLVQTVNVVAKEIMTLSDFLAAETVAEALIEVIVTSLAPFNSYAVADATGAVAYRVGGKNATNIDLEVGDKILALVKKAVFNGLVQAELLSGNEHIILEKGVTLPPPADITEVELTAQALLVYQSHLVSITSAEVTAVSVDQYNNLSITIETALGSIVARYDDRHKAEGIESLYDIEVGDTVMINAAPIGWTNAGPRIEIDSVANVIKLDIISIAEFVQLAQDDVATVKGIITHFGPLNSFSMEDETGAFAFRIGGKTSMNAGLEIGEELIVKVKKNVYNGLVQGELVDGLMISLSKGNDLPELLDLTEANLENLSAYQGRLVLIENAEVLTHTVDGFGTVQMTVSNGNGAVIVRWDNRILGVDGEFLKSLKAGDIITVNGATISWFNAAQIMIGATDEIILEEAGPEPTEPEPTEPEPGVDGLLAHYDFGTTAKTGYTAGDLVWTNTDGTTITAAKDRSQINTSTFAPHNGEHFLVMSVRNTHHEAWIEFNFNMINLTKITLEINVWNNSILQQVKDTPNGKFVLQVKVDGEWVDVEHAEGLVDMLPLLSFEEYVEVSFDVNGAGLYRIIYSGNSTASNNTTTAVAVDNIKLWAGESVEPTEPQPTEPQPTEPQPTEPEPTPVEGELLAHYDFGTAAKTGYTAGDLVWTNTDGSTITVAKDRSQINTSTFAPHNGEHFLVMSVRNTNHEAWVEFDFDQEGLSKITIEINVWNNSILQQVKDTPNGKFVLQVKVDGEWVDVEHADGLVDMLPLLSFEEYVEVSFDVDGAGLYRLYYYGESTVSSNTTHAVTVDNIKLWS